MATYNDSIFTVIRNRLIPKIQAVSLEISAIEPYSYSGQDLIMLRKEFEYYTMLYDFLIEYATGLEEIDNDKLTNIFYTVTHIILLIYLINNSFFDSVNSPVLN